eukprot:scaffold18325_cov110-Skeletonema_marinoi.AAC.5
MAKDNAIAAKATRSSLCDVWDAIGPAIHDKVTSIRHIFLACLEDFCVISLWRTGLIPLDGSIVIPKVRTYSPY